MSNRTKCAVMPGMVNPPPWQTCRLMKLTLRHPKCHGCPIWAKRRTQDDEMDKDSKDIPHIEGGTRGSYDRL